MPYRPGTSHLSATSVIMSQSSQAKDIEIQNNHLVVNVAIMFRCSLLKNQLNVVFIYNVSYESFFILFPGVPSC